MSSRRSWRPVHDSGRCRGSWSRSSMRTRWRSSHRAPTTRRAPWRDAPRARLGIHLVRHLVARWGGARRAAALTRRRPRGPHERGRKRWHDAAPNERHGPLAARILPARVGGGRKRPRRILPALLAAVERIPAFAGVVYPDHRRFLRPKAWSAPCARCCAPPGSETPTTRRNWRRSSSTRWRCATPRSWPRSSRLTGTRIPGIHIVGGGATNTYLNQATADAAGRPVIAGPVEATAVGNLLVQALATGTLSSLEEGRRRIAAGSPLRRFEPRVTGRFDAAARVFAHLEASL